MSTFLVGPPNGVGYTDGATPSGPRMAKSGEQVFSEVQGRYYEQGTRGNIYMAQAIVTAPVIYTTAAGTGGPLLWNGTATVKASILAIGWGVSTVSTVGAAIGLTGGAGQTAAPTATTAIDGRTSSLMGGPTSSCTPYRVGTVVTAGTFLIPFGQLNTGALTTSPGAMNWIDLGGFIVVPQYGWVSVAASATASTTVMTVSMIWAETPVV